MLHNVILPEVMVNTVPGNALETIRALFLVKLLL
jgi:hypothetical protein